MVLDKAYSENTVDGLMMGTIVITTDASALCKKAYRDANDDCKMVWQTMETLDWAVVMSKCIWVIDQ